MTAEGDTPAAAATDIRARLARGEVAAAEAALAAAAARWPGNPSVLLATGDVLLHTAGRDAAVAHHTGLVAAGIALPWPASRIQAAVQAGPVAPDVAMRAAAACARAPLDPKVRQAVLHELVARSAPGDRLALLESFAPEAGLFRFELRLATEYAERADVAAALAVLERAGREGRSTPQGRVLEAELIAIHRSLHEGIAALERLRADEPGYTDLYRRLILLHQRAGAFERAADLFDETLDRWPADWMILYRFNRLTVPRDRLLRTFARLKADAGDVAARDDRFRYQFALASLDAGDIAEGMALLARPFEEPVAALAAPVAAVVRSRSAAWWSRSSRLVDDRTAEVQVVRAPGPARATVVVTTGALFGNLPHAFLDALLAGHGVNAVYLRDFRKRAFVRGIPALAPDEPGTIAALRALLDDLGAPRTILMGSSAGGFSAMRYGALLGADDAVSFAGPSLASTFFETTAASVWNPSYLVHLLTGHEPDLPFDLVPVLQAARGTRFHQYYGADNANDVQQAARLAGLPGVTLRPVAGVDGHLVVDHLIVDGRFDALVDALARGEAPPGPGTPA